MRNIIIKLNHIPSDVPKELDPDFVDLIVQDGTKSLLIIPLKAANTVFGSVLFASFKYENLWNDDLVRRLMLVAEIISSAILREQKDLELSEHHNHLEQLVEKRTAQLKQAQEELVKSERLAAIGKVAATVSHELRNPLGTIRSSLYVIEKRLLAESTKIQTAFGRAERGIDRCDRIIEELLDFTRTHVLQMVDTSVNEFLEELLDDNIPPEGIRIEKKLEKDVSVRIDRERYRRCLINLLTNAYQAISQKDRDRNLGLVQVYTRSKDEFLEISIIDNGVGFDASDREKIYEPLYSTKSFGVGLGMPIARQIIEQHGGRIDIKSIPGEGTSVTIHLPIEKVG